MGSTCEGGSRGAKAGGLRNWPRIISFGAFSFWVKLF
jgi:hypothetical protein